jgi:hypothetical protein
MICLAFEGKILQSSKKTFHFKYTFEKAMRNQKSAISGISLVELIYGLEKLRLLLNKTHQIWCTKERYHTATKTLLKQKRSPQKNCSDLKGRTPLVLQDIKAYPPKLHKFK